MRAWGRCGWYRSGRRSRCPGRWPGRPCTGACGWSAMPPTWCLRWPGRGFTPAGPLAVRPFAGGRSSIVWTLPDARAAQVLALDDDAFARELTRAFDARLGPMRVVSKRAAFPLRRQLAQSHVHGRVLVVGDAAHVVHPLAGQGVNLGLRDVSALRDAVADARRRRADWTDRKSTRLNSSH